MRFDPDNPEHIQWIEENSQTTANLKKKSDNKNESDSSSEDDDPQVKKLKVFFLIRYKFLFVSETFGTH